MPQDNQNVWEELLVMSISCILLKTSHNIVSEGYAISQVNVYGCNWSILWSCLENTVPKYLIINIAIFQ